MGKQHIRRVLRAEPCFRDEANWCTSCEFCKEGLTHDSHNCYQRPLAHNRGARHQKNQRSFEDKVEAEALMIRRAATVKHIKEHGSSSVTNRPSLVIPDECITKILSFAGLPPLFPTHDASNGRLLEPFCPDEPWRHSAVKQYLVKLLNDRPAWFRSIRDGLNGEASFLMEPRCRYLDKERFLHNFFNLSLAIQEHEKLK